MHFERHFKMHKNVFFPEKKCVLTQPKIFRHVTQNTLILLFGLTKVCVYQYPE